MKNFSLQCKTACGGPVKAKKQCRHAFKKMPFVIRYAPDRCKFQEKCDKALLENDGLSEFFLDCYKKYKMCIKTVDNYAHALQFVPDYYKSQGMRNEAVSCSTSAVQFVTECYKTQEVSDKDDNTYIWLCF